MKQRRIRCLAAAAFVLLFLGAAWFTGCDLSLMWSRRDHLTDIAAKMFPPDWGFLGKVLPLLWATIQMSITGTFLGAVLSIPAAMACAAALPGPGPVKKAVRFCIQVLRSFPALILALNHYAWHDVRTLALGMIALSWLVDLVSAFCRRRDA